MPVAEHPHLVWNTGGAEVIEERSLPIALRRLRIGVPHLETAQYICEARNQRDNESAVRQVVQHGPPKMPDVATLLEQRLNR